MPDSSPTQTSIADLKARLKSCLTTKMDAARIELESYLAAWVAEYTPGMSLPIANLILATRAHFALAGVISPELAERVGLSREGFTSVHNRICESGILVIPFKNCNSHDYPYGRPILFSLSVNDDSARAAFYGRGRQGNTIRFEDVIFPLGSIEICIDNFVDGLAPNMLGEILCLNEDPPLNDMF